MFKIKIKFEDFMGRVEIQEESTDLWEQAFGAFSIYVSHPDCCFCEVSVGEKVVLRYQALD